LNLEKKKEKTEAVKREKDKSGRHKAHGESTMSYVLSQKLRGEN